MAPCSGRNWFSFVKALLLALPLCLFYDEAWSAESADLFELPLVELLQVKVITASKTVEPQAQAPGVMSVVTAKEIERFGATSLRDVLERVTSIHGFTSGLSRNVLLLRGDYHSDSTIHLLVLIDGRPTRERTKGGTEMDLFAMFPIESIDRIEVIRGPGSVLYGTNAYSGVINIITKKAETPTLTVSAFSGSGKGASLNGGTTIGGMNINGGLKAYDLDKWDYKWTDPQHVLLDVSGRNRGIGMDLNLGYNGFTADTVYIKWYNHNAAGAELETDRIFIDLGYTHSITDTWDTSFNITDTYFDMYGSRGRASNDLTVEWTNHITPSDDLKVVAGALYNPFQGESFSVNQVTGAETTSVERTEKEWYGVYVQADYRLTESSRLIAGLQGNKIEGIDFDVVPRLGVIWGPFGDFYIKTLYGQAFRGPTLSETSRDDDRRKPNPGIRPEKIDTYDIELIYGTERFRYSLAGFYNHQKDLVALESWPYDTDSAYPFWENNVDKYTSKGIELEAKFVPDRNWMLLGSILYQTNELDRGSETIDSASPVGDLSSKNRHLLCY